jgi:hypothetical protein
LSEKFFDVDANDFVKRADTAIAFATASDVLQVESTHKIAAVHTFGRTATHNHSLRHIFRPSRRVTTPGIGGIHGSKRAVDVEADSGRGAHWHLFFRYGGSD